MMPVCVTVENLSGFESCPDDEQFQRWAAVALSVSARFREDAEVYIRVVDEEEMQALNTQYRHQPKPTNVLSFPFEPPPEVTSNYLGDIIICAQVVDREAHTQGKPAEFHWAHMVVHGILHLLGFDHETETDAEQMERLEAQLLTGLGFSNPYRWPIEEIQADE